MKNFSHDRHIENFISRIHKDIQETFPNLDSLKESENQQVIFLFALINFAKSLENILEAFVFYRPDVGYVKVKTLIFSRSKLALRECHI